MKDLTGNNAAEPAGGTHGAAEHPTDRIRNEELDAESTQRIRTGRSSGFVAAIVAGAVLVVLAVVYLVDLLGTSGEIERNTTIAGVDVGGMTPTEATAALTAQAVPVYGRPVTVDVHGEPTQINPEAAGLTADIAATVQEVGLRSASPVARVTSFFMSTDVPLAVTTDEAALSTFLQGVADSTDVARVEGEVAIEGTSVRTVEPVTGRTLELEPAVDAVASAWAAGGPTALNGLVLPVSDAPVRASAAKVAAAAAEATKIRSAPIRLVGEGATVQVPVTGIAAATTIAPDDADGFIVAVDVAKIRAPYTDPIEATQAAPKDAVIAIQNGAPVITPGAAGPHRRLEGHRGGHRNRAARRRPRRHRRLRDRATLVHHREGEVARHQGGHRGVHHRRLRGCVRREHPGGRREGQRRHRRSQVPPSGSTSSPARGVPNRAMSQPR